MTQTIVPVVIGLIQKQDLFLIAKRPERVTMPHYWEFPGGKIEPGETQFSALVRELEEEIDITVTHAEHLIQDTVVIQEKKFELNLWQVTHYLKTPRGNENQELRWINIHQFDDYVFLPSNRFLLDWIKKCSLGEAQRNPGLVD